MEVRASWPLLALLSLPSWGADKAVRTVALLPASLAASLPVTPPGLVPASLPAARVGALPGLPSSQPGLAAPGLAPAAAAPAARPEAAARLEAAASAVESPASAGLASRAAAAPAAGSALGPAAALPDGAFFDGGLPRGALDWKPPRAPADLFEPTPEQARRIRLMTLMAHAFLKERGMFFPDLLAPHSASQRAGVRGILVSRPGDQTLGSEEGGWIGLNGKYLDALTAEEMAPTLLHELVHHLNPSGRSDEVLSYALESEFILWLEARREARGEARRWAGLLTLRARHARWTRALLDAYRGGRLHEYILARYGEEARLGGRRHPIGYERGSAGARDFVERIIRPRLARPEYAGSLVRRDLDLYTRLVIPALEAYERASGLK